MNISDAINLARTIEKQLPATLSDFLKAAGRLAEKQQQRLYLVGGLVRDLLLERNNLDLDLVVEGDAINLAQMLAGINRAEVTTHARFGTAKLQWENWHVDVATARSESYARPGALPTVKPGTISDDLTRRDFTINAMAVELNPRHFGKLLDPHAGKADLESRLVRILHDKSFIDDATRIWRALRYEQRLDFHIEPATLKLLKQNTGMLSTVSGDRIRNELLLILKEEFPEKALFRAGELGVLNRVCPSLKADAWLAATFELAREQYAGTPSPQLYLALLAYRLTSEETERLINYLRLPRSFSLVLRDSMAIEEKIKELSVHGLAPSRIYALLHGYSSTTLKASALAIDNTTTSEHIELYLNVLKTVHTTLTGEDLKKLGVPEGPMFKEILQRLHEARLDGKVSSHKDEDAMVRAFINK